jgi:hypothetical protein
LSPLDKGDYPELDTSKFIDLQGIKIYQFMIGALQWAVTPGRFDILETIMTMSGFCVMPRQGHFDRLKRIYGFLKIHPYKAIRFRTGIPDHEAIRMPETNDWAYSVYGEQPEELSHNLPIQRGLPVRITTYKDANLINDLLTGRSVTGCIHLVNQTPFYWFSKEQNLVGTATYGLEFVAARLATEQIMDLKYTLKSLGVPIDGPA